MPSASFVRLTTVIVHGLLIAPFVVADVGFVVALVAPMFQASPDHGYNIPFVLTFGLAPLIVLLAVGPFAWLMRRWWRGQRAGRLLLALADVGLVVMAVLIADVGVDVWGPRRFAIAAIYVSLAALGLALLAADEWREARARR